LTKKDRIVKEAAKLFAEKGYIETSTAEIAEAAETATGTIFYHFATKEGILKEIYETLIREYLRAMEHAADEAENGMDALERILRLHFRLAKDYRAEFTTVHRDMPAQIIYDDERRTRMRTNSDISVKIVRNVLEQGIKDGSIRPETDADSTAKLIKAMMMGLARVTLLNLTEFADAEKTTLQFCRAALDNRGSK